MFGKKFVRVVLSHSINREKSWKEPNSVGEREQNMNVIGN